MDTIKFILIVIGLLAIGIVGYFLVGLVLGLLWYAIVLGLLGAVGYGGYKLFKKLDQPQLEGKQDVAIREMDNAERTLEEYKQKYLPK